MRPFESILSLDVGQTQDPSALVLCQVNESRLELGYLHRFQLRTEYPYIVEAVTKLLDTERYRDKTLLLIDGTGVGRPVVNLFWQAKRAGQLKCVGVLPITITAGRTPGREGGFLTVPKRDLATATKVMLEQDELKIAEDLDSKQLLIEELNTFKVKISQAGNDTYSAWRERDHDDLVLATAMACWVMHTRKKAQRKVPSPTEQAEQAQATRTLQPPQLRSAEELRQAQEGWTLWDLLYRGGRI